MLALGVLLQAGCGHPETTMSQVGEMFEKVGGIEKVNTEARAMFARFGTNELRFVYDQDLKDFPAIAALGNSVGIYPATSGLAANIRIRFGSHANTEFIFIYDPNDSSGVKEQTASGFLQVSTNIFVSK